MAGSLNNDQLPFNRARLFQRLQKRHLIGKAAPTSLTARTRSSKVTPALT